MVQNYVLRYSANPVGNLKDHKWQTAIKNLYDLRSLSSVACNKLNMFAQLQQKLKLWTGLCVRMLSLILDLLGWYIWEFYQSHANKIVKLEIARAYT